MEKGEGMDGGKRNEDEKIRNPKKNKKKAENDRHRKIEKRLQYIILREQI